MSSKPAQQQVRNLTVERFISALHKVGLRPEPIKKQVEVPSPITGTKRKRDSSEFYVTKLMDYTIHDDEDREEWRKWRKEQRLPSASMVSSYFGNGYRSLNVELKDIVGTLEDKPIDPFVQKMMDHGNDNELHAKNAYMTQTPDRWGIEWIANGNMSYIFEVEHNEKKSNILATPDMVIVMPETPEMATHTRVVEIKCPTYGILMKKKPLRDVVDDFNTMYPHGKPGHFLQAATYALLFNCKYFDLFYYFTDTINYEWVKISYELKQETKEAIFNALHYCTMYIEKVSTLPEGTSHSPVKRPPGKTTGIDLARDSYLEKVVYYADPEDLQEEASDESEE